MDANLLKQNSVTQMDAKMIELQNGCICCTLRDEFMTQIDELSKDKSIDYILVEASGVSNPASIAEGFLLYCETHKKVQFYLDTVVTVVDADRIYTEFLKEIEQLTQSEQETDPDIINLVIDQIEFCNTILLNKCDLLEREKLDEVKKVIRDIQKDAEIIECVNGVVSPEKILQGKTFDFESVMNSSAIQKALKREKKLDGIMDDYGITSFVFEDRRPLNYNRFMDFVEQDYPETMIRAKGYVWFSDDDIHVQLFEQAGHNASVSEVSNWIAAFDEKDKKEVFEAFPEVEEEWDEKYGDRYNQIVFIGRNYDKDKIIAKLEACLDESYDSVDR